MILNCPACETSYEVPDTVIGPEGRYVACARCNHRWQATFARAVPVEEPPLLDEDEDIDPPPQLVDEIDTFDPPIEFQDLETAAQHHDFDDAGLGKHRVIVKRKTQKSLISGHAVVVGLAIGLLGAGIWLREPVVRAVPQTAALFELIGLDVNLVGLDFQELAWERKIENGTPVLIISGRIVNVSDAGAYVPAVRLSLLTGDKDELFSWVTEPETRTLEAGTAVDFAARLASPPDEATNVMVRFTPRERVKVGMNQ